MADKPIIAGTTEALEEGYNKVPPAPWPKAHVVILGRGTMTISQGGKVIDTYKMLEATIEFTGDKIVE